MDAGSRIEYVILSQEKHAVLLLHPYFVYASDADMLNDKGEHIVHICVRGNYVCMQ